MPELTAAPETVAAEPGEEAGGMRELFRIALPLVLSSSFWTLQITVDRVLLNGLGNEVVGAAMMAALLFWTPLVLIQQTAAYAGTFVAQYLGAGRPRRVGPAVGQALYFAVAAGLGFIAVLVPLTGPFMGLVGHEPGMRALEADYFRPLCFAALPMCVIAAANSFFIGRGAAWAVLLVDAVGCGLNIVLGYGWIYGHFGLPAWGVAGAGWATAVASGCAALVAVGLFLRPQHRKEFATDQFWRFDGALFLRLLRFGLPNGLQYSLEGVAFGVYLALLGQLGTVELAATSIALTINMSAFIPLLGLAQAVCVLVGRYLGADRPELAERSTISGLKWAALYTLPLALLYGFAPGLFTWMFPPQGDPAEAAAVAAYIPVLLRFAAVYAVFDGLNLVYSFALRGAGDTRFVSLLAATIPWPVAVLPAWLLVQTHGRLEWAWVALTAYILVLGVCFVLRFRQGKWKTMRVIEPAVIEEPIPV